jgi:hypothetical protein
MMLKKTIWPTNQSTSTSIQSRKFTLKLIERISEFRSMME